MATLWRFTASVPSPEGSEANPRQWVEGFARTLAETLRFTAAARLDIQSSELRATYRLRARAIEIILYDAVAGGAGYCVRLAEAVAMKGLIAEAVRRLECPAECASACTACLCDYSNQAHWDYLDRRPVQGWLAGLRDEVSEDIYPGLGLQRWHAPSSPALADALKSGPEAHLLAPSLVGDAGEEQIPLTWLLDLLNAGIRLHLHLIQSPIVTAVSATVAQRGALRYLAPYLEDGRLRIDLLKDLEPVDLTQLPRVATGTVAGARCWFSLLPTVPLLQVLLPEPVYRGNLIESVAQGLRDYLSAARPLAPDVFRPVMPIKRWELNAGDVRHPSLWFAPLVGETVSTVTIKDPYCGAGARQIASLADLVGWLVGSAAHVDRLVVHAKEQYQRDPAYRPRHEVARVLTDALRGVYRGNLLVLVQEFAKARAFHDRTIDIALVDSDGCRVEYRYDITGGIDFLLDSSKPTKVFCYRVEV